MLSIQENLQRIKSSIPSNVGLVAVSKFHPNEAIMEAYSCGHRMFGESRVQELQQKQLSLPNDIEWHFIGHLQTNKVKNIVSFVSLIHAVDSEKLLAEISKEGAKKSRIVPCLLQVHIAQEEVKFGFDADELRTLLSKNINRLYPNAQVCGLMGMASLTSNMEQVRLEFRGLKQLFDELKRTYFSNQPQFCQLSMGMSGDYTIAIEEGSTLIRIGSSIFGSRS